MVNKTSQHILATAANLLGFCLFVITSLHISNYSATSLIDEFTSLVALLLIFSCFFSFYSIRTESDKRTLIFEKTAEYFFIAAIVGTMLIIIFMALNFLK
ncbi:MAG: hypothetical protein JSS91_07165 [Bacteroidetes bacterium]|nr:hypothetical protein [Bacteroidota bacterium]